jgi:hypothetical protein
VGHGCFGGRGLEINPYVYRVCDFSAQCKAANRCGNRCGAQDGHVLTDTLVWISAITLGGLKSCQYYRGGGLLP